MNIVYRQTIGGVLQQNNRQEGELNGSEGELDMHQYGWTNVYVVTGRWLTKQYGCHSEERKNNQVEKMVTLDCRRTAQILGLFFELIELQLLVLLELNILKP